MLQENEPQNKTQHFKLSVVIVKDDLLVFNSGCKKIIIIKIPCHTPPDNKPHTDKGGMRKTSDKQSLTPDLANHEMSNSIWLQNMEGEDNNSPWD